MSTTKPGQIRCPTCLRSTPPAAYCTQCGSPIPASARIRPRGMDRDELEERIRSRRPDDAAFRRGMPADDPYGAGDPTRPQGYVPFQPEPEDALVGREPEPPGAPRHVDHTPQDFDAPPRPEPPPHAPPAYVPPPEPPPEPPAGAYRPHVPEAPASQPVAAAFAPPVPQPADVEPPYARAADEEPASAEPQYAEPQYAEPQYAEPQYATADDESEYGPEDAYPRPYASRGGDDGRRGGGALPIIGFVALSALALAVGAALAGIVAGPDEVGQATPSPTAAPPSATLEPTPSPSVPASASEVASATPEPTDGPVTFADGAVITVQPCASAEMGFDGCAKDGSVIEGDNMWVWIGFDDALGADTFILELRSQDVTIDRQEKALGEILDCPNRCSGYLIGAAYQDLDPGQYELLVRRNGDFADRTAFDVSG